MPAKITIFLFSEGCGKKYIYANKLLNVKYSHSFTEKNSVKKHVSSQLTFQIDSIVSCQPFVVNEDPEKKT